MTLASSASLILASPASEPPASASLRQLLSVKQEARAVLMGLLK
jgi:hypothetical protein